MGFSDKPATYNPRACLVLFVVSGVDVVKSEAHSDDGESLIRYKRNNVVQPFCRVEYG
jgi:hypothetical protein